LDLPHPPATCRHGGPADPADDHLAGTAPQNVGTPTVSSGSRPAITPPRCATRPGWPRSASSRTCAARQPGPIRRRTSWWARTKRTGAPPITGRRPDRQPDAAA